MRREDESPLEFIHRIRPTGVLRDIVQAGMSDRSLNLRPKERWHFDENPTTVLSDMDADAFQYLMLLVGVMMHQHPEEAWLYGWTSDMPPTLAHEDRFRPTVLIDYDLGDDPRT